MNSACTHFTLFFLRMYNYKYIQVYSLHEGKEETNCRSQEFIAMFAKMTLLYDDVLRNVMLSFLQTRLILLAYVDLKLFEITLPITVVC